MWAGVPAHSFRAMSHRPSAAPRALPLVAVLATLAVLLLAVATADARTTAKPRCGAQTTTVGPRNAPRACLPKAATPDALAKRTLALVSRAGKGGRRSRSAERLAPRLAKRLAAIKAAGGRLHVPSAKASSRAARAGVAQAGPSGLGTPLEYRADGDRETGRWQEQGLDVRVEGDSNGMTVDARDRTGAGGTFGLRKGHDVPSCPTGDGRLPARYDSTMIVGRATSTHGKRTWIRMTTRVDGKWTGRIGVGARAERYDADLRGVVEVRSGVEIASTGKVLRRDATRTYRVALTKQGIPIGTDIKSVGSELRMRTPKGTRVDSQDDLDRLTGAALGIAIAMEDIDAELAKGDERWFQRRECAVIDYTRSPEKVVKGGSGEWEAWVTAADGVPVTGSRWAPSSTCGALSTTTVGANRARMRVTDTAGTWDYEPHAPACVAIDVTTPAGRPRLVLSTIDVEPPGRWRYTIKVVYKADMGSDVVQTEMTGSGSVVLGPRERETIGTGSYSGTEWASGVDNTCGEDMTRARGFTGTATVGATANDDGTVSVAFTANERPLTMAWIVVVPATGGTERITAKQPFCGEPGRAATQSDITVTRTKIE